MTNSEPIDWMLHVEEIAKWRCRDGTFYSPVTLGLIRAHSRLRTRGIKGPLEFRLEPQRALDLQAEVCGSLSQTIGQWCVINNEYQNPQLICWIIGAAVYQGETGSQDVVCWGEDD